MEDSKAKTTLLGVLNTKPRVCTLFSSLLCAGNCAWWFYFDIWWVLMSYNQTANTQLQIAAQVTWERGRSFGVLFFLFLGGFFWSVLVPDPATLLLSFPHQEEFCKLVAALCDHLHQSLSLSLVILTLVSARTFMTGCPLVQSPEKMTWRQYLMCRQSLDHSLRTSCLKCISPDPILDLRG